MELHRGLLMTCFILHLSFVNPVIVPAQDNASGCNSQRFSADQLNPSKWGDNFQMNKYCFGTTTNQKELFSRRFLHGDKTGHHVAILCRIATTKTKITAAAVFNFGKFDANFKQLSKTDTEVVWVMNGQRQSHGINAYVTFWGSDDNEKAVVECTGYHSGKRDCGYHDYPIENGNKTCPAT